MSTWSRALRAGRAVIFLAAPAALMIQHGPAVADISGSLHDFANITALSRDSGTCTPCHMVHWAPEPDAIWVRTLSGVGQEKEFFETETNIPPEQSYALQQTVLCYDCHSDANTTVTDNDPNDIDFAYRPHDVAFDDNFTKPAAPLDEYGAWDGKGGAQGPDAQIGYFEDRYTVGNLTLRGGHYFRTFDPDEVNNTAYDQYDKLPCRDCHDPHETDNEAFIKTELAGVTISGARRSHNSRVGQRLGTGETNGMRQVCAACHGYANDGRIVYPSDLNPAYTNSVDAIVHTPPGVVSHNSGGPGACTDCHSHQRPWDVSNCWLCHSDNTTQEMKDSLGDYILVDNGTGDDFGYNTTYASMHDIGNWSSEDSEMCQECHELFPGHPDGRSYNDMKFRSGKDWPVSSVVETGNTSGSLIEFCLACHRGSTPPSTWDPGAGNATDINTLIDTASVTNEYGFVDPSSSAPYNGTAPTFYDTANNTGNETWHDPPLGYSDVPMLAHFTQHPSLSGSRWWQIGAMDPPHPLPCLDCHFAHGSGSQALYRSPNPPATNLRSESSAPREICLDCHDGVKAVEGIQVPDPTTAGANNTPLPDRFGLAVPAHDPNATSRGCTPSAGGGNVTAGCHNPHSPSCEVCHGYPPDS